MHPESMQPPLMAALPEMPTAPFLNRGLPAILPMGHTMLKLIAQGLYLLHHPMIFHVLCSCQCTVYMYNLSPCETVLIHFTEYLCNLFAAVHACSSDVCSSAFYRTMNYSVQLVAQWSLQSVDPAAFHFYSYILHRSQFVTNHLEGSQFSHA